MNDSNISDVATSIDAELSGGQNRERESNRKVARPVHIDRIYPDPTQPRRIIPQAVMNTWKDQQSKSIWLVWLELAGDETGDRNAVVQWFDAILNQRDCDLPDHLGYLTSRLVTQARQAVTVLKKGLDSPIHVVKVSEDYYQIESGERRFRSFQLLHDLFPEDERWVKVPCFFEKEFDVMRQANENGAREDLNAIAKARQLAIILIDIYSHNGVEFRPYDQCQTDQSYYGQVSDGEVFRIPRGFGQQIMTAMRLNNETQLRQYRALLRLPPELWIQADETNMTEGELRGQVHPASTSAHNAPNSTQGEAGGSVRGKTLKHYITVEIQNDWRDLLKCDPANPDDKAAAIEFLKGIKETVSYLESLLLDFGA